MHKWINSFLVVCCCLFLAPNTFAQNKDQLKNKRHKIQQDIKRLNSLLGETKVNKKKSEIQLIILKKKIGARQELISAIAYEVRIIDQEIAEQEQAIDSLQSNLETLKNQYTQMVVFAYKNRNATNKLIFIFSADDFNQAYKRLKYIHEIGEYRKYQAELIKKEQILINEKIAQLEQKKARKLGLIENKKEEREKLEGEQNERKELYVELRKDEAKLRKELENKQAASKKLQDEIKRIIEREMKEAMAKNQKKGEAFALTPQAQKLSNDFASNLGKLPWPVDRGTISGHFGNQKHAVFEHLRTINNGIDILTSRGSKAQAVFGGKVAAIIVLPGDKSAVLVQHGLYFTMYSNLATVYVKKGDEVITGQELGMIKTDEAGKTELHFELWKGNEKQDPSLWILKR